MSYSTDTVSAPSSHRWSSSCRAFADVCTQAVAAAAAAVKGCRELTVEYYAMYRRSPQVVLPSNNEHTLRQNQRYTTVQLLHTAGHSAKEQRLIFTPPCLPPLPFPLAFLPTEAQLSNSDTESTRTDSNGSNAPATKRPRHASSATDTDAHSTSRTHACEGASPSIPPAATAPASGGGVSSDPGVENVNGGDVAGQPAGTGKRTDYLVWDDYFMSVAFLSAMRSKDPSTQVGAW